jgi:hypothetical protein
VVAHTCENSIFPPPRPKTVRPASAKGDGCCVGRRGCELRNTVTGGRCRVEGKEEGGSEGKECSDPNVSACGPANGKGSDFRENCEEEHEYKKKEGDRC